MYVLNVWEKKVNLKSLSRVLLFATPWTVAYQASPSMEFSRQEYWSGLPFPIFLTQGLNPALPHCRQTLYHLSHRGSPKCLRLLNKLEWVHAKSLHDIWLCNTMDYRPPGCSVHGILQARMLEWVVVPSSRGCSRLMDWTWASYVSCIGSWALYH